MSKGDAEIKVGADATAVEQAAGVMSAAMRSAASAMKSAIGGATQSIITDLGNVALAQGKVNFSAQHDQVKQFEASSARLAVAMGRDLDSVRSSVERTGVAIGKRPSEVASWADAVGKLTGNFDGATEAMKGLAGLGAMTGRTADDYKGLAVELAVVGKVGGDTTHVIGGLVAQSKAFGTVGGPATFASQIEALSDTISHFAIKGEADFLKVTAAAGALGKGLSDPAARRVQQSALGAIASAPLDWARFVGHDITDENGQVKDPGKVLKDIQAETFRRYGHGSRAQRALQWNFGAEAGAALFKADFSGKGTGALAASGAPQAALDKYLGTDAGKRDVAGAQLDVSSRELLGSSTKLGQAADALQRFAASNPLTSTFVSTALSTGMGSFLSNFGSKLTGIFSSGIGGGGVGNARGVLNSGGLGAKLGAVGFAAGSVALAYDQIKGTADEIYGNRGGFSSFADDLKYKLSGHAAESTGASKGAQAQAYLDQEKRNLELAHATARARETASGAQSAFSLAESTGLLKAGTGDRVSGGADLNALVAALVNGMKGVKIEVTNAADTPVQAVVQNSHSPRSGKQGK